MSISPASRVRLGNTSMITRLWLRRDEELLVEGLMRHVVVDAKSWQKTEIPDWLRQGLEPYLLGDRH